MPIGSWSQREFWCRDRKYLMVYRESKDVYWYGENFVKTQRLRFNSSGFSAVDFKILKQPEEVIKMKYENNVIVTTNKGMFKDFESETEALEFIQDEMDNNPKTKFKIFKAYKTVEPKRLDIAGLIKDL